MAINLDRNAQQLLGAYQQVADLTAQQEQALQAHGDKPICRADLEKLLDPGCLKEAHALVKCNPRGDDNIFNTQIVGRPKVIKESVAVQRPRQRPVGIGKRDPYYAKMEIDPRAALVVLTSGSKFEPGVDRPRPRLMKLVVRTEDRAGEPTDKDFENLERLLKESSTQKFVWDPKGDEVPTKELDIHWIGSKTASIETKDVNEPEFDFGSSIVAISSGKDGGELSRTNALNPINIQRTQTYASIGNSNRANFAQPIGAPVDRQVQDTTPPETFDHKIGVDFNAKNLPQGTFADTKGVGAKLDVNMRLGSRWMMEAGATGSVTLLGQKLDTKVGKEDVYFNGSHSGLVGVPINEGYSVGDVLRQHVRKDFGVVATDKGNGNVAVASLFFARHKGVEVAGHALGGLLDKEFAPGATPGMQVTKRPIKDAEKNGLAFDIELGPEFLKSDNGSLKGFALDVGHRAENPEGELAWCPAAHKAGDGLVKVATQGCAKDTKFTLNFTDFPAAREANQPIEVIVRDNKGLPLARVRIQLDTVEWA